MKNFKIPIIASVIACLIIGIFIVGIWKMGWFRSAPEEPKSPVREIGLDKDMKEGIFKQMSERQQEALAPFTTIDENGQKTYNWQNIEDLLHKASSDIEITDYVSLLQFVGEMTEAHADGTVTTDFEALGNLLQRGYEGACLTPVMANLCILYKEWVEDFVLVPPGTFVITEEQKTLAEHLRQEMLIASMLDGVLMNDDEVLQGKNLKSQHSPEINIIYTQGESQFDKHYLIQIGNRTVKIQPFLYNPSSYIYDEATRNIESLDETAKKNKIEEYELLRQVIKAYAVGATTAISEDGNIRMVVCFFEAELEIRAHAYGSHIYKYMDEPKDPSYLNITASDLKTQFFSNDSEQTKKYLIWWQYNRQSYDNYKDVLDEILGEYETDHPEFIGKRIERLTPAQIIELDKKLRANEKGEDYILDLGEVP
jgi:hypothetical protein